MDLTELLASIREHIPHLSKSQKAVADFIVANPERFALSSIRQLEKDLGTSKSSIVRVAQTLGYDGFHELKNLLLENLRRDVTPIKNYNMRFRNEQAHLDDANIQTDILGLLAQETVDNINATLRQVDPDQFNLAVDIIIQADHIYCMGEGVSSFLTGMTSFLLTRIGMRCVAMNSQIRNFTEQVISLGARDALLAISFKPYSQTTRNALGLARERGIRSIAISDAPTSPLALLCDAFFPVSVISSTFSNSIICPQMLLYALVTKVGYSRKAQTLSTLEAIDKLRSNNR